MALGPGNEIQFEPLESVSEVVGQTQEKPAPWSRSLLDALYPDDKDIPPEGAVSMGEDGRTPSVPRSVEQYLQKLYGKTAIVRLSSSHRREDRSGVSYAVYEEQGDGKFNHIADMESINTPMHFMPDYQGRHRGGYDTVQEKNRLLPSGSKPYEYSPTVWMVAESKRAQEARRAQDAFRKMKEIGFDPIQIPDTE